MQALPENTLDATSTDQRWSVRALIVDDDVAIRELLCDYLTRFNINARGVTDGSQMRQALTDETFDVVVLDLMLPGEDGFSICRTVRDRYDGPILMLTARTDDTDHIQGLDTGADDFVCKPVHPRVLLARIHALLRRSEAPQVPAAELRRLVFGPLVVDNALREAWLREQSIELTGAEFDLLWLLVANAGRTLSREEIFTALRGVGYDGQDRSIDVRISRIRPKIGDDPIHPRLIKTVRSKGYLFVPEAAQDMSGHVFSG
ncbi:response regulator [Pseudomonas syringae]|nr:response regulator transcription factor [Pseudomonas syringae]